MPAVKRLQAVLPKSALLSGMCAYGRAAITNVPQKAHL